MKRASSGASPAELGSKSGSDTMASSSPVSMSITMPAPPMAWKSAIACAVSSRTMFWMRMSSESAIWPVALAQHVVERLLDAGEAVIVDIGEAGDVGGEPALRIDAPILLLEIEAGQAEPVDGIALAAASGCA